MGGLRRHPLHGLSLAKPERPCAPVPPGVRILSNTCIAPGFKMLSKANWLVKVLPLIAPTDGYDFDTIIVSPDDIVSVMGRQAPRPVVPADPAPR
jgi:hypothetical protein